MGLKNPKFSSLSGNYHSQVNAASCIITALPTFLASLSVADKSWCLSQHELQKTHPIFLMILFSEI